MKERPILFSGPMVRALLAGTKTQTRRVVKPQPTWSEEVKTTHTGPGPLIWPIGGLGQQCGAPIFFDGQKDGAFGIRNPYGQPGDRLWVRETWLSLEENGFAVDPDVVYYRADGEQVSAKIEGESYNLSKVWRPSIFMPRWASRITLEVVTVRVERLQDISEEDSVNEGIEPTFGQWKNYTDPAVVCQKPMASYRTLWESINGPNSWSLNPWVWVIEFKRI